MSGDRVDIEQVMNDLEDLLNDLAAVQGREIGTTSAERASLNRALLNAADRAAAVSSDLKLAYWEYRE